MKHIFCLLLLLCVRQELSSQGLFTKEFNFDVEVTDYEVYKNLKYQCYYKYSVYEISPDNYSEEREYKSKFILPLKVPKDHFVSIKFYVKKGGNSYAEKEWNRQRNKFEEIPVGELDLKNIPVSVSITDRRELKETASVKDLINSFKSLVVSRSLDQLQDNQSFELNKSIPLGTFIFYDKTKQYVDYYTDPSLTEEKLGVEDKLINRLDASLSKFIKVDKNASVELSTSGPLQGISASIKDSKYSEISLTLKNRANRNLKNYSLIPREIVAKEDPNIFFKTAFNYVKNVEAEKLDNYRLYFVSNIVILDSLISKIKNYKELSVEQGIDLAVSQVFEFSQVGQFSSGKEYNEELTASNWQISFKVDDLSSLFHFSAKVYLDKERIAKDKKIWEQSRSFYEEKYNKSSKSLMSIYNKFHQRYNESLYKPIHQHLFGPFDLDDLGDIELVVDDITFLSELTPLNDSETDEKTKSLRIKHDRNLKTLQHRLDEYNSSYSSYETFNKLIDFNTDDFDLSAFTVKTIPAPEELSNAIKRKTIGGD